MKLFVESRIAGEFTGWEGETIFELQNGQEWEQAVYKYKYVYKYCPKVKVWKDGSRYFLEVEGVDEQLPVRQA